MRGPAHISDVMSGALHDPLSRKARKPFFPFAAWADANRFQYQPEARGFLSSTGSAAEAFFARPFTERQGVEYCDARAFTADRMLELQVRCNGYYIDAVASDSTTSLALEIDGLGFHWRRKEQVAADYVRQRRIVLAGHTVIRFTAQEVFATPDECWRQIEAIFAKRRSR